MRTAEIRRRWLAFFEERGHTVVPSASVISPDPSTLFVIAGMVPFIPYFLGEADPPFSRATSVQKCVRTGDIEEVGKTTRHGTFFQMNGNFSFNDYFKEGAIGFAWEFITGSEDAGCLGFDPDDIWVTVYHDDDEAAELWRSIAGIPDERIQRRGREDNFWHTGQPGPGGTCSEIYVDRGPEYGQEGGPIVDEDRYLEIWNLVFMQYRIADVKSKSDFQIVGELGTQNIDTGMGLERVAILKQGVDNLYEIDEVFAVIKAAEQLSGKRYGENTDDDVRMRVVADHVRTSLIMIGDGVRPSNEGRGYVLRRLLRRAIRAMRLLGVNEVALPTLLPASEAVMKESYPVLEQDFDRISELAYAEERSFLRTLESGTVLLENAVSELTVPQTPGGTGARVLSGDDAFTLHDTHGFPIDLTIEIARELGVGVDETRFRELMTEQRMRARADAKAKKSGHVDIAAYEGIRRQLDQPVTFVGYTDSQSQSQVQAVLVDGSPVPVAQAPADVEVILDVTPFYAEAGGQLADTGRIVFDHGAVVEVHDVQAPIKGLPVHRGRLVSGSLAVGDSGVSSIDQVRRGNIARAHTATHMVHQALREELGDHATQAGSENAPNRFRFDFRSGSAVPASSLSEIEGRVNTRLLENLEVTDAVMSLDEARSLGAMALFGEKYGDRVRVVSIGGDWSRELCAGTHVPSSASLGQITLLGESSIGSGVRRIDALVGAGAYENSAREHALVSQLTSLVGGHRDELLPKISSLLAKVKDAERELSRVRAQQARDQARQLAHDPEVIGEIRAVVSDLGAVAGADDLRTAVLEIRGTLPESHPGVVALFGQSNGRPLVVVATNATARGRGIEAGALVRTASTELGGGGGGKADIAQGGGSDVQAIETAISAVRSQLESSHGA